MAISKTYSYEADTATRIATVAEIIFAERGYRGVSLREVMRESGVNSAAIHYHFGSKEALLEAIFFRRAGALNAAREQLLARCLQRHAQAQASREEHLTAILRAFLAPAFALPDDSTGGQRFSRLRSVLAHENIELSQRLIAKYFNETSRKFINALRDVLPEIPVGAIYWRFHFLLGAQYYMLSQPGRMKSLAGASVDLGNLQMGLNEMVAFAAYGFSAPLASNEVTQDDLVLNDVVEKTPVYLRRSPTKALKSAFAKDEEKLSDFAWQSVELLMPPPPARRKRHPGRVRIDDREALDGVLCILRKNLRWRDLDQMTNQRSGASCWRRLQAWKEAGCWSAVVATLKSKLPDGATLDFERLR